MRISKEGYLERQTGRVSHIESGYRDWWAIRATIGRFGVLHLGKTTICFPEEYVGKKVRFKIEVMDEPGH